MSLNIKNADAHKLAQELAELTGESLTEAVTVALRERLERVRHQQDAHDLAEQLMAIGRDTASRMPEWFLSVDHGDLLYDEKGLPK